MRFLLRDARLALNPREGWAAIAAEQARTPRLWPRVAVVASLLCAMDLLELAFCDAGLPSSGPLRQTALVASALYLALNAASIAFFLAAASLAGPLLAQSMGGKGDARFGMALTVYANVNTGWLVLNAVSLDATCHGAATGWVFGEGLAAHALSWSIFPAYVAYAVHLLRQGAMALLEVPANRATAFASIFISTNLAGIWLAELGPAPQIVLLGLLGV